MELRKEKDFSGITKWYINILPFNPTTRNLEKKTLVNILVTFY